MAIYLVQHGLSLSKDQDPERGLSEKGVAETRRIAEVARGYNVTVSAVFHSGKKRARQTADIIAEYLKPEQGVQQMDGLNPLDDCRLLAAKIEKAGNTMFVGHLPFMSALTAFLVTGTTDRPVFKFQNSGIVCLDIDPDTQSWIIKWTLMPNIS